jgi:pimeloyl-ACP methyl ester carboxylesterase
MYDERNGFRTPPEASRCAPEFLERYRTAQRARCARIDSIARSHIEQARFAREYSRSAEFNSAPADRRRDASRRSMAPHYLIVYRTAANPNYLDLSLDPSERVVGSIFAPRPDLVNYSTFGLGRIVTPDAWLSTWSGLSSYANVARNLPKVPVPTLVVGANADQDIFISDVREQYELSGATDKTLAFIEGADHFMRAGGTRKNLGDPRSRLMKLLADWSRARFAP